MPLNKPQSLASTFQRISINEEGSQCGQASHGGGDVGHLVALQTQSPQFRHPVEGRRRDVVDEIVVQIEVRQTLAVLEVVLLNSPDPVETQSEITKFRITDSSVDVSEKGLHNRQRHQTFRHGFLVNVSHFAIDDAEDLQRGAFVNSERDSRDVTVVDGQRCQLGIVRGKPVVEEAEIVHCFPSHYQIGEVVEGPDCRGHVANSTALHVQMVHRGRRTVECVMRDDVNVIMVDV